MTYVDGLDDRPRPGGFPIWYLGSFGEGGVAIVVGLGMLLLVAAVLGARRKDRNPPEAT